MIYKSKIITCVLALLVLFPALVPLNAYAVDPSVEYDVVQPPLSVQISLTLDAEATRQTTTTVALTKYPITGNFTYSPMVGFTQSGDILTYSGTDTRDIRIDLFPGMKSDSNATTVHIGIFYNGVLYAPQSVMGTFEKTAGEAKSLSVGCIFEDVETGDTFQFVLWSNVAGAVITVTHLTGIISASGR